MPLPQVIIEVGCSGPVAGGTALRLGDATYGLLGTNTLGGADLWVDVSRWVRSWQFRRGASRGDQPTLRYEAGTATIELNNGDRRFDATNLAGPYVSAGRTQIVPMVRVRIRAIWQGVNYFLWYGYADMWRQVYQGTSWSTVILTATDANKIFAQWDRTAVAPVGAGELSGVRVARILDGIGWPAEDRNIAGGDTAVQATTLAGNVLTELQLTQDTERGEVFVDELGRVVYRNRRAILTRSRSATSQAIWGDSTASGVEKPYADVTVDTDDQGMANLITIARAGGTAQVVSDSDSIARYLTKTYQRLDLLLTSDAESAAYASWLLYQTSTPELRFSELKHKRPRPQVEAAVWPLILAAGFADRHTIRKRPPGGGAVIERDVFVRGIAMASDGERWDTTWTLQSATRYSFLLLGDATYGRLGQNALGF